MPSIHFTDLCYCIKFILRILVASLYQQPFNQWKVVIHDSFLSFQLHLLNNHQKRPKYYTGILYASLSHFEVIMAQWQLLPKKISKDIKQKWPFNFSHFKNITPSHYISQAFFFMDFNTESSSRNMIQKKSQTLVLILQYSQETEFFDLFIASSA